MLGRLLVRAGSVVSDDVSVSPKPLPTRASGNASMILCTVSAAIGAPP